ncbi:acetate--CoA ligase family protein [Chloroflexota bacterium]
MIQKLDRLFNPSSLAIIGASKDEQKGGGMFLKGLINSGFKGKLYPVNTKESEIMGLRNYRSVLDIPGEVDLAYVTVPAKTVPQVMVECSQKGVRFAVVHSVGFSELGAEGKKLEEEMLSFARQGGTRIIGPNCMGLYSPEAHINTIAPETISKDEVGPVAFVGQSGWVTQNVIQLGYERGLRFSKVVSIGNQSDLTFQDLLEYFANDANTKVIAFYIEGIKGEMDFIQLTRQIYKKKPIIIWKAGKSKVGVGAAASHTGSPASNNVIFNTAHEQGAIAIAENLDELIDLMVGFTCPVLPKGNKVGLLVEAGGAAVAAAAADAADKLGLKVPTLSAKIQKELVDKLKDVLPPFPSPRNPVDLVWPPYNGDVVPLLRQCAQIMLREVDTMVMLCHAVFDDYFAKGIRSLIDETGKPIFIIPGHIAERRNGMALLTKNGIPTFTIPERTLKTLSAIVRYSNYQNQS